MKPNEIRAAIALNLELECEKVTSHQDGCSGGYGWSAVFDQYTSDGPGWILGSDLREISPFCWRWSPNREESYVFCACELTVSFLRAQRLAEYLKGESVESPELPAFPFEVKGKASSVLARIRGISAALTLYQEVARKIHDKEKELDVLIKQEADLIEGLKNLGVTLEPDGDVKEISPTLSEVTIPDDALPVL